MSANCPECDAPVTPPADAVVGELVTCSDCAVELEVTALSPLTLQLAPPEEEDWGE